MKLGIFAVVALVLIAGLAAKVGNISFFSHRYSLHALLSDASGLAPTDSVKIAGVTVGQVTGITTRHGDALVTMALNDGVKVRSSTDVGMKWRNVLGIKYLYLYPGSSGAWLKPGATIPASHDVSSPSVGKLLNSLGPFLAAINPQEANAFVTSVSGALAGNSAKVSQLIDNAAVVAQTVGSLEGQVGSGITNLDQVVSALAQRNSALGQVIGNLQALAGTLEQRNSLLDGTVQNLSVAAGEFAHLESANSANLTQAIDSLEAIAKEIQLHQSSFAKGISTLAAGVAPYVYTSSWGQWFQVQAVYSCIAELPCSYKQPTNAPGGSSLPAGLPAGLPSGASPASPAETSGLAGAAETPGSAAGTTTTGGGSSISSWLGQIAGSSPAAGGSSGGGSAG